MQPQPTRNDQRRKALQKANKVRTGRKELKERLALGTEDARALLAKPTALISEVEIIEFLTWVPHIGKTTAKGIMSKTETSGTLHVGCLGEATRRRIAQYLPPTA